MKKFLGIFLVVFSLATPSQAGLWDDFLSLFQGEKILEVGAASEDVTPPIGVPLAGYGGGKRRLIPWDFWGKYKYSRFLVPSNGIMDPIRSKAMVIRHGEKQIVFISLDVIGVTKDFRSDLVKALEPLGFDDESVFVAATHTHSGPGNLSRSFIWQIIAADRFDKKVYRDFLAGVARSVDHAQSKLEEAELWATSFEAKDLQSNRRNRPGHFDSQASLVLARSARSDQWIGAMAHLAIHPTSLGTDNHQFSADVAGAIEYATSDRLAEMNSDPETPVPVLFLNGAEGDVAPNGRDQEGMQKIGDDFADQAMVALNNNARKLESKIKVRSADLKLPRAGLNVRGCIKANFFRALVFKRFRLFLGFWLHNKTKLWNIQIGDLMMMTWPGEPTTSLGLELKEYALDNGAEHVINLGLTNDYMGYLTNRKEYFGKTYEACSTLHTHRAGEMVIKKHKEIMEQ